MMTKILRDIGASVLMVLVLGTAGSAQTTINGGRVVTGAWDASNAASSKPAKTGTALPMTCGVGEQFFKTNASQGQNLYFCTSQNTWVQMTGGSGGSGSGSGGGASVLLYKGDLAGFATQNARIPVGPDGSSLTADSTQGSGVGYRYVSGSDVFANRPACTAALTGQTFYPTDGILGYRCNGTTWTAFGPISPVTPLRVNGTNASGVVGTGSTLLTAAAGSSGNLTVSSCASFPSTVTMLLVDSEIIAGSCSGTTFTPISGGRGYNQTTASGHSAGAGAREQLFVWGNTNNGTSTLGQSVIAANSGYLAFTENLGSQYLPVLTKPVPNGPNSSYTVTVGFIPSGAPSGDQGCGVGFRQSSNDNEAIALFHTITYSATGFVLGYYQETDASFSGGYLNNLAAMMLTGNGLYFRLQDNLSQRNLYVSSDGINFSLVSSLSRNDFLTADQIFVSCTAGTVPGVASFFSWTESN